MHLRLSGILHNCVRKPRRHLSARGRRVPDAGKGVVLHALGHPDFPIFWQLRESRWTGWYWVEILHIHLRVDFRCLGFVYFFSPETRGLTLEELELLFNNDTTFTVMGQKMLVTIPTDRLEPKVALNVEHDDVGPEVKSD